MPPKATATWAWNVDASGGATARAHGFDPAASLDVDLVRTWWGLRVGGLFIDGGRSPVRVWELVVGAGPTAEVFRIGRWSLDAAVLFGAHRHDFVVGDDRGVRWDFSVDFPATLRWKPAAPLTVGLVVRPALDSRARRHVQDGVILWSRGAFRLTAGVSVGVEFGPG